MRGWRCGLCGRMETGGYEAVPAGEIGQLRVRGPVVFTEYYNDPVKTKKAFAEGE